MFNQTFDGATPRVLTAVDAATKIPPVLDGAPPNSVSR